MVQCNNNSDNNDDYNDDEQMTMIMPTKSSSLA